MLKFQDCIEEISAILVHSKTNSRCFSFISKIYRLRLCCEAQRSGICIASFTNTLQNSQQTKFLRFLRFSSTVKPINAVFFPTNPNFIECF